MVVAAVGSVVGAVASHIAEATSAVVVEEVAGVVVLVVKRLLLVVLLGRLWPVLLVLMLLCVRKHNDF